MMKKVLLIVLIAVIVCAGIFLFKNQTPTNNNVSETNIMTKKQIVDSILSFQKQDGGFGEFYNSSSDFASTEDTVGGLYKLNYLSYLDKNKVINYVQSKKNPDGTYGEDKLTTTAYAASILYYLNATNYIDRDGILDFLDKQKDKNIEVYWVYDSLFISDYLQNNSEILVNYLMDGYKSNHFELNGSDAISSTFFAMNFLRGINKTSVVNVEEITKFMRKNLEDDKNVQECSKILRYLNTFDETTKNDLNNAKKCLFYNIEKGNYFDYTCNPKYHEDIKNMVNFECGSKPQVSIYIDIAFLEKQIGFIN